MHIIGHIIIGVVGSSITSDPLFLLGSLFPDIILIPNELREGEFNKWDVKYKIIYNITHSIYPILFLSLFNIYFAIGYLIHLIIDIPFHSSIFRSNIFLLNKYKEQKKALLLSGGADSIACAELERGYDCYFFDYGQKYLEEEKQYAIEYCIKRNIKLNIITKKWHTDIKNRNYYFIAEIKKMGYNEVIIGTRNIIPLFDKYKDSNWFNLKILQYLFGIYINMPIILKTKKEIKKIINNYEYYSTEGL